MNDPFLSFAFGTIFGGFIVISVVVLANMWNRSTTYRPARHPHDIAGFYTKENTND